MPISTRVANRIGFILLGLTNNFAFMLMLSAAYDLLKQLSSTQGTHANHLQVGFNGSSTPVPPSTEKYCNNRSTSSVLLANSLPALIIKLVIYPILLAKVKTVYKAWAVAFFVAASLIITGVCRSEFLIFVGVVCASISAGLGEVTFMSITPLYGDEALNGWSTGTGVAGFIGSFVYSSLRFFIPTMYIMLLLLIAPVIMLLAYHFVIRHCSDEELETRGTIRHLGSKDYGTNRTGNIIEGSELSEANDLYLDAKSKIQMFPTIAKYFLPLAIVYYAEYFINQGLVELIYYPGTSIGGLQLDHATQYTWFQTAYAAGVMVSRSSLDLFHIKFLWAMAVLQCANTIFFLAHTSKLIYIPGFLLALGIVFYEGLLGGFTFVSAFHRIKKEVEPYKREFCISSVTSADSTGMVLAALTALPTYQALCSLYE